MKKKIGAILAAGIMACTMTAGVALTSGCGAVKPDFNMPEEGFNTDKNVTITFYHTMNQYLREVLDNYIAEFNKLYPNITVNHSQIGGYNDVKEQIEDEILAGTQPNIAYCYPDHVATFNRAGAVQSLNDFLSNGALNDWTVTQVKVDEYGEVEYDDNGDALTVQVPLNFTADEEDKFIEAYFNEGYGFDDGSKMYTLPFAKSTEVLYYNKTFFDDHKLKVPTTWNEMEKVCEEIKKIDSNCWPFGYDSEANWFITMCEQYGSGYTSLTGNKYRFNNDTNKEFVKKFKGWYDKGYFTTQEIYGSYTSDLFVETSGKKIYMCIGSSAGASNQIPEPVDDVYPFEVDIAPIPQVHSTVEGHADYKAGYQAKVISQGPSVCIFKQDDPQEVLASWLFLKYLTTNIAFQAEFSAASGYVPVLNLETMRTNAGYARKLDNANGYANLTALSAKVCMGQTDTFYTSPAFVGSSKAREEVGLLMQNVFVGPTSIEQAFREALEECEYYNK